MALSATLQRPTVFAGLIAATAAVAVAIAGGIAGVITAYFQHDAEANKLRTTILLELVKKDEAERKLQTRLFLQSGILSDEDGRICRAFVGDGCPIKPP